MKAETFLNTLILSLSVSTVLITLISYLIYKMKQFPKNSREVREATKKEGTFFRRHIPGEVISEGTETTLEEKRSKFARFNTLPFYFGLLAFIIFSSLIFKDVFTGIIDGWKRKTQITKIHELKDQNLLNLYELDISTKSSEMKEHVPETYRRFLQEKIQFLKNQKISILSWSNNKKLNLNHHTKSLAGWTAFLKKHDLTFTVSEGLEDKASDIYIIPQALSLSGAQKTYLTELSALGKGLLFTGPCGVLDGTGGKVDENWCEKNFSMKFLPHDVNEPSKPTLFASKRNPGWMVPPGLLLSWLPEDESYRAFCEDGEASAFEATFSGKLLKENNKTPVRGLFRHIETTKMGWFALEPHGIEGKIPSELFYGESALIDVLSWLQKGPHVELSHFRGDHDHAMIISVDSESEIEGAYAIWKILEESSTPATFFVVADQMKNDDRLSKIDSPFFDLGSHSLDHTILTAKKIDAQFNNIQESRLSLEEKFGRAVKGFHPPEERFNDDTINVVLQNKFDYFVGDQRFFRMGPLFIEPGLVYVPRVFKDDILIKKNRGLISNEDVRSAMSEDLEEAKFLGGLYYFNSHSQIFGKGFYLDVLKEFLEKNPGEKTWKTSFGELSTWWRERSSLVLTLKPGLLSITTTSGQDVKDVLVYISGKPNLVTVPKGDKGVELKL